MISKICFLIQRNNTAVFKNNGVNLNHLFFFVKPGSLRSTILVARREISFTF